MNTQSCRTFFIRQKTKETWTYLAS